MGFGPKIVVPPPSTLPSAPDQSAIQVQQFGAMIRRRAAAGYGSTFAAGPAGQGPPDVRGTPAPFRTDTPPATGSGGGTTISIDPATGMPIETVAPETLARRAAAAEAARIAEEEEEARLARRSAVRNYEDRGMPV